MDVQSCIEAYHLLAKEIFTPRRRTHVGGAFLHKVFGSSTFSAEKLERGIRKIVRENYPDTHSTERNGVQTEAGSVNPSDSNRIEAPTVNAAPIDDAKKEELLMCTEGSSKCKMYAAYPYYGLLLILCVG